MKQGQRRLIALICAALLSSGCSAPASKPDVAAAACPPAAPTSAEPAGLASLAQVAEREGVVRVIVRLADTGVAQPAMASARNEAVAAFKAAGAPFAEALGGRLPYVVAEVNAEQLRAMYADVRFGEWSEDRIAFATLAQSAPLIGAPQVWALGGRGAGQAVAILDTGVDGAHPFLAGRVTAEACFSTASAANISTSACPNGQSSQLGAGAARPCGQAGCEHGTHVAGIAAGRGADFSGVAPDADIIAVQVFSVFRGAACGGAGQSCVASFTSDQIRGLDFVLQQAASRNVAAVNMSLGGGRSRTYCDGDATKPLIDALRAAGVATVIASGNDGFRDSVSFPGCISSAVTVGATTKADTVAGFSNCGPQTDLHAPGVAIRSSIPNERFAAFDGTSMATPHVAGAFAALRALHPEASVDAIEAALKSTGVDTGGRPRIRLVEAHSALSAVPAQEGAMAQPSSGEGEVPGLAELASADEDAVVRVIARVASAQGADRAAVDAALVRAEAAARAAGVASVERMGSQPMLVIEARAGAVRALALSGAIASVQVDSIAHTQK